MCSAFEEMNSTKAKVKELWAGPSVDSWCSKTTLKGIEENIVLKHPKIYEHKKYNEVIELSNKVLAQEKKKTIQLSGDTTYKWKG